MKTLIKMDLSQSLKDRFKANNIVISSFSITSTDEPKRVNVQLVTADGVYKTTRIQLQFLRECVKSDDLLLSFWKTLIRSDVQK